MQLRLQIYLVTFVSSICFELAPCWPSWLPCATRSLFHCVLCSIAVCGRKLPLCNFFSFRLCRFPATTVRLQHWYSFPVFVSLCVAWSYLDLHFRQPASEDCPSAVFSTFFHHTLLWSLCLVFACPLAQIGIVQGTLGLHARIQDVAVFGVQASSCALECQISLSLTPTPVCAISADWQLATVCGCVRAGCASEAQSMFLSLGFFVATQLFPRFVTQMQGV